jgi:large subunit ribosomal protein L9
MFRMWALPRESKVKVVFLEDVPGTAQVGEVKVVRNGFARNYLLPRNLASPATTNAIQHATALAKVEERRQAGLDADAQKQLERFVGTKITVRARVGEQGRLYGSVTAGDIAEEISRLIGGEFDRRKIELPEPLRETGEYQVAIRMTRNVHGAVEVAVVPEE